MPIFTPASRLLSPPHPDLEPASVVRLLTPHLRGARRRRIERVLGHRLASLTVVIERPHDPHNGAAILRTAEALGLLDVHIIQGEDRFSFSRKVTISAHKWLNVYVYDDTVSCLGLLRGAGYRLWAALPPVLGSDPHAAVAVDASQPTALVFGNEHAGLTDEAIAACAGRFHLPMFGFMESYNLSVSVALALQQVAASRRKAIGRLGDVTGEARDRLRAAYYARSTRHALKILLNHLNTMEQERGAHGSEIVQGSVSS